MSLSPALRSGDVAELPGRRQEDWRWTDLRGLIRVLPEPSPTVDEAVQSGGPFEGLSKAELVIANGRHNWWPGRDAARVKFTQHETPDAPLGVADLPMPQLAVREATSPAVSIITLAQDASVQVRFVSDAHDTRHSARLGIVVKAGASAVLLESYEGSGSGYLANYLVEIFIEPGARLERIAILDEAPDAVMVTTGDVHLGAQSSFSQTVFTAGAKRQRFETHVQHPGSGARLRLDGAYLLDGRRHADLTSVVAHEGVDGTTAQLTKGAVSGQARAVFQGRIVVAEGADRTDARMGHHALILSDRAEVDAKPELEIYADDVSCSHGNTVGALDEEALFYAQARGIPEAEARALLTEAFVGEVIDRIEHEGARDVARAWAAARLRSAQP
jgi:Fe-S cluster assembly protein SufD